MSRLPYHMGCSESMARRISVVQSRPEMINAPPKKVADAVGCSVMSVRSFRFIYRWGQTVELSISKIKRDGGLQSRAEISAETVTEYSESMKTGAPFPPITVYYDGTDYWLADGFHRVEAALKAGLKKITADVKMGEKRDAILYSVGVNSNHGLRRTNADKHRAVNRLLSDPEWCLWSNSEIARRCSVTHPFVGKLRPETVRPANENAGNEPKSNGSIMKPFQDRTDQDAAKPPLNNSRLASRNGTVYQQNTANIGPKPKPEQPDTSVESEPPKPAEIRTEPLPAPIPAVSVVTGKTRVNGVLQDDPPDVAELRTRIGMKPDYVPEVTEPTQREPGCDDDEPMADYAEAEATVSDAAWLESLPLFERLNGTPHKTFAADASLYRMLEPVRERYVAKAREVMTKSKGPFQLRVSRFLGTKDPSRWNACPAMNEGGCGGEGSVPMIGACPKCNGAGYLVY